MAALNVMLKAIMVDQLLNQIVLGKLAGKFESDFLDKPSAPVYMDRPVLSCHAELGLKRIAVPLDRTHFVSPAFQNSNSYTSFNSLVRL